MSNTEQATFVADLNDQRPTGDEPISYGDDHIRLIKKTLVESFPNVAGAVTADHTELSYVDGVTSPIQTQLDGLDGRVTTNTNNISSNSSAITALDARVLKNESDIADNKAAIEAVDKKVDDQTIGDHADVEFEGAPEDGDVMVFDGGKWRAKKPQSGNVMRLDIVQPKVCGEFSSEGWFLWQASYQNPSSSSGTSKTFTFTNPQAGLKFMLRNIKVFTGNGPDFQGEGLTIDGVAPFSGWGSDAKVSLTERPDNDTGGYNFFVKVFPIAVDVYELQPKPDDNAPLIEVKQSIQIPITGIPSQQYTDGRVRVQVEGWFVEDK